MEEHLGHCWNPFSRRTIIFYKAEPRFHITVYNLSREGGKERLLGKETMGSLSLFPLSVLAVTTPNLSGSI